MFTRRRGGATINSIVAMFRARLRESKLIQRKNIQEIVEENI